MGIVRDDVSIHPHLHSYSRWFRVKGEHEFDVVEKIGHWVKGGVSRRYTILQADGVFDRLSERPVRWSVWVESLA